MIAEDKEFARISVRVPRRIQCTALSKPPNRLETSR